VKPVKRTRDGARIFTALKKEAGKGGRPSKMEEARETIIEHLRACVPIEVACAAARVSARAYFGWIAKGEQNPSGKYGQFAVDCRAALAQAEIALITIVLEAAKTGKLGGWLPAMTTLSRRWPVRWAHRTAPIEPVSPGDTIEPEPKPEAKNLTVTDSTTPVFPDPSSMTPVSH